MLFYNKTYIKICAGLLGTQEMLEVKFWERYVPQNGRREIKKKKKCRMFNLWIYNCFGIILYNILFTYLQIFFILVLKELVCMCVWVICYLTKSNLKRIYKNNLNGLLWWRNFRWFYSFMLLCITIFFYTVCIHYVVKV